MRHAIIGMFAALALSAYSGEEAATIAEEAGVAGATVTQAADTHGAVEVEVVEWVVPYENSGPRDPYVGPDKRVWFVGQRDDYVAVFDPESREFTRYELDDGTGPHNLIVDDDGTVWFAGNRQAYIGKLNPEDGSIHKIPMPDDAARDPHTLVFDGLGNIWFTVQGGNFVGRLNKASEQVDLVEIGVSRARPYGIIVDPDNVPWIVLFGSHYLVTIDPATLAQKLIGLPRDSARPRRIGRTSDGGLWYVDYAEGYLGRYDPATGEFKEWAMPGGENSRPYAMSVDDNDNVWVFESGLDPNRLSGFDPASETWIAGANIPSGGGTVRHSVYDPDTGLIWFGTDTNTLGKAQVR